MEKLARLFGRSMRFAYHCFDRIMIRGYLSALARPENIVYFFRTIKQVECISKETLRQQTDQYLSWVNAYTTNHQIPITWAQKDVRKKDDLAHLRTRMQREGRTGLYYVLKSMEQGPSFRIVKPESVQVSLSVPAKVTTGPASLPSMIVSARTRGFVGAVLLTVTSFPPKLMFST